MTNDTHPLMLAAHRFKDATGRLVALMDQLYAAIAEEQVPRSLEAECQAAMDSFDEAYARWTTLMAIETAEGTEGATP